MRPIPRIIASNYLVMKRMFQLGHVALTGETVGKWRLDFSLPPNRSLGELFIISTRSSWTPNKKNMVSHTVQLIRLSTLILSSLQCVANVAVFWSSFWIGISRAPNYNLLDQIFTFYELVWEARESLDATLSKLRTQWVMSPPLAATLQLPPCLWRGPEVSQSEECQPIMGHMTRRVA
jgi:hypothetical protein